MFRSTVYLAATHDAGPLEPRRCSRTMNSASVAGGEAPTHSVGPEPVFGGIDEPPRALLQK